MYFLYGGGSAVVWLRMWGSLIGWGVGVGVVGAGSAALEVYHTACTFPCLNRFYE